MVKVTDEMINEEEDCIDVPGYKEYFNREVWEPKRLRVFTHSHL